MPETPFCVIIQERGVRVETTPQSLKTMNLDLSQSCLSPIEWRLLKVVLLESHLPLTKEGRQAKTIIN
jgi:hypothetical protein